MGLGVTHFQILARDRKKLADFYRDLFGWELSPNDDMDFTSIDAGSDRGIAGTIIGAKEKFGATIAIETDDPDGASQRATELGGTATEPIREVPNMVRVGRIAEPTGIEVGIFKDLGGIG